MQYFFLFAFLFVGFSLSQNATISSVGGANAANGEYCQYNITEASDGSSYSITAIRVTVSTSDTTDTATAAGYGFKYWGPSGGPGTGAYFGEFAYHASFTPGSSLSISAAKVELGFFLYAWALYNDNDGNPGFQYYLGNEIICGLTSATEDCLVLGSFALFSSYTWGPIVHTTSLCPTGYAAGCRVHTFTVSTNGANAGIASVSLTVASQPVYLNGILLKTDYGKLTISASYPYPTPQPANAKVVIFGLAGGTAAAGSATVQVVKNTPVVAFGGAAASAYLGWDSSAQITTSGNVVKTTTVYSANFTGAALTGCSTCPLEVQLLGDLVTTVQAVAVGWVFQFLVFSCVDVLPANFYWDPTVGSDTSGSSSSMGLMTAPILWLTVCVVLVHLWWSFKRL